MSEAYDAAVEVREALFTLTAAVREQTSVQQDMLAVLKFIAQRLAEANER